MQRFGICVSLMIFSVVVFLGIAASTAQAEAAWLSVGPDGAAAVDEAAAVVAPEVAARSFGEAGLSVAVQVAGFGVEPVETAAGRFVRASWPDASIYGDVGGPAIPVVRRLLVAPLGARVSFTVNQGAPTVVNLAAAGLPAGLAPVQPPVPKIPGALENAELRYDEAAYAIDAAGPVERAVLTELGIVRGQRVFLLEIRPVAYNPAAGEVIWWPQLSVDVAFAGGFAPRADLSALPGLQQMVLNPDLIPSAAGRGTGHYVIIVASAYETDIASFATAKAGQGFSVTTWVPTTATTTAIKAYIQGLYDGADPPDYILLVGDTDTIPNWVGGGVGTPATDLPYSCMDGTTDWYPDIPLGRFPVRSAAHVQAIVDKTLYYENGGLSDPDYLNRAVFMASQDNYTVSEGTHNWVINNYMTPNDIVCNKLYCHTYNATTQQVRDAFNDGRFFGIYSGHGGTYSWADGPVFSQSDVNNLTNGDMYPFVCSFACITGTYTVDECFCETWIRAAGKGALAIYGSSVNSYWTEDDVLEKRLFDSIYDEGDDVPAEVGPVWNDARMRYLAQMGSGSTTRRYFEMYNLLGDPSLPFPNSRGLAVTPGDTLAASGEVGGPFTPDSIVYTLENEGDTTLDYSVAKTEPWLTITNGSGSLIPGATADVTVSINAAASTLGIGEYRDTVSFINTTDHRGDSARSVDLQVGVPQLLHNFPMDTNPGWSTEGSWQFGQPTGGGSYNGDPTGGHTGDNVYGYNLSGDYGPSIPVYYLTTPALDCRGYVVVELEFWKWLGVETSFFDHANVQVSNNGTSWTTIWEHSGASVSDSAWSEMVFDISSLAAGEETVYVRWGMGPTDGSSSFPGWNIDDVQVWGIALQQATCSDGIQNQGEERIDCGGPSCSPCTCTADATCGNGIYCDGAETCDAYGECQAGTAVDCSDDGLFCNGTEFCDEGADACASTGDPCADNGLFCDGTEFCDEGADICDSTGDPCVAPEVCDEGADTCSVISTTIESAACCKDQGGTEFCLSMAVAGPATCEPRQGGIAALALQTADAVEVGTTTATATCVNNVYGGTVTVTSDGSTTVLVDMDPLPDQDCCTIEFAGGIEGSLTVQVLAGDVNGDGSVSTADGSSIKQRIGTIVDGSDFWYDVNLDGNMSTADGSSVKQRLGNVAPNCP
ncbi:MAG TPA: C25 family cysteine peptidase [Phycisphaerae bacterium]|nr:C25 family cysteine peptidase [Phycisphaerae bacterium]